jgi:hypothetical protein
MSEKAPATFARGSVETADAIIANSWVMHESESDNVYAAPPP